MVQDAERRRNDIVNFCLRKPRRYKEIAERYDVGDGSINVDLKVLTENDHLEKTIYNGKPAYQVNSDDKKVKEKIGFNRKELERSFEEKDGVIDSNTSEYDKKLDIDMPTLKEVLEDNLDNSLIDEEWAKDFDPNNMSDKDIENIGKLLRRLSPPRRENNMDVQLKKGKIGGGYNGPQFLINDTDDEDFFIQRVEFLQSFNRENPSNTRYKVLESSENCDDCGEEVKKGEKLFLIDQPRNLTVLCEQCNKKKEVIEVL